MNPYIVVGMIVFNEEKYIRYSIGAIYNQVDHIVIVDSFSNDKTIDIIKQIDVDKKITILQRKWTDNYAAQRNRYLNFIKENIYPKHQNLWYLRIDADEVYFTSQIEKFKNIISENQNVLGFRLNFYTFEGSHETLSKTNPEESRVCLFKYNPEMFYTNAIHEMPIVKGNGDKFKPLYTYNNYDDAHLGIKTISGVSYCHFSWCDPKKNFDKALKYTEQYIKEGKETQERLNSIEPNEESWWWQGHKSDNKFTGAYPEIFEKLGHLHAFKKNAKIMELLTDGKFTTIDGKLGFETENTSIKNDNVQNLSNGSFSMIDGKLVFKTENEPAKINKTQNLSNGLFSVVDGKLQFNQKEMDIPKQKLSAFTIVKNAIKFDYPIVESINSVLPYVDEYVINIGLPDEDGTRSLIMQNFSGNLKVKIIEEIWEGKDQGIKFLTSQTNIAKNHCTNEWALYVQADELYYEDDFIKMKDLISKYNNNLSIIAFAFDFLHFDGDYATVNPSSYEKGIRLVRRNYVNSIHDAVTFGVKAFSNIPVMNMQNCFINSDIKVFHYGWVREPKKMLKKLVDFDGFYHNDAELKEMHSDFDKKHVNGYDYGKRENHIHFKGKHPKAATARIRNFEKNYPELCKNFVFDKPYAEEGKKQTYNHIFETIINGKKYAWQNDLMNDEYIMLGDHVPVPGLGDSILHTAVIREVNKKYPNKKIILRTIADQSAFENNPRIFKIEKGLIPHSIDIPTGHYIEQKCRYFGIEDAEIKGEIFITDKERAIAEETLHLLSGNKPAIMFCYNSTNKQKNWIKENWIKIIDVLNEKYDVYQIEQLIHYSRATDRPEEFGRPVIYPTIPNARQELRDAAGGLRKIMALMSVSKKYLGVNTSFMNIAACFGNDNIVFQHDVDMDGQKLRDVMKNRIRKDSINELGFMDMSEENIFNNFKNQRPEWLYPGTKYFDQTYDVDTVIRRIKDLWM